MSEKTYWNGEPAQCRRVMVEGAALTLRMIDDAVEVARSQALGEKAGEP
jgi:hypothetical protein